jgi:hypothetical protein
MIPRAENQAVFARSGALRDHGLEPRTKKMAGGLGKPTGAYMRPAISPLADATLGLWAEILQILFIPESAEFRLPFSHVGCKFTTGDLDCQVA